MRCCVVLVVLFVSIGAAQVGRIDTVGGTTFDWQMNGPALRLLCNSPGFGAHIVWMFSASQQTTFPDRNMRYNYYDYAGRRWVGNDSDFMQSGFDVFHGRSGYGSLAADPHSGAAIVSGHGGTPQRPTAARDMFPGAFIFEFCSGPEGFAWPVIASDSNGWVHAAVVDDGASALHYARCTTWAGWEEPVRVSDTLPDPCYPNHNIAASLVSSRVVVTWTDNSAVPGEVLYRESTDGGSTWLPVCTLPLPPAFQGDTATGCHQGVFPYIDSQDRTHFVCTLRPFVGGQGLVTPVEIWHWCRENDPPWSEVHRAGCRPENLQASAGYNALYACRPSIGEGLDRSLYVAWEQFDSANVEPGPPERLRADVFFAWSDDNGASWSLAMKLTRGGSVSHRFPCIIDRMPEDWDLAVCYLVDQHAGFFQYGEGPATDNPVVVNWRMVLGVEESEHQRLPGEVGLQGRTVLRGTDLARIDCRVLDIQGRDVTEEKARLAPGIYFIGKGSRGRGSEGSRVRKVILQQ